MIDSAKSCLHSKLKGILVAISGKSFKLSHRKNIVRFQGLTELTGATSRENHTMQVVGENVISAMCGKDNLWGGTNIIALGLTGMRKERDLLWLQI